MKRARLVRLAIVVAVMCVAAPCAAGKPPTPTCSWDDACIARLLAHPPVLSRDRLPPGHRIGRCLLQIDGRVLIRGACSYTIEKAGDFEINGPRQVFDGIDYPKAGDMASMISTDWWATVFKSDGAWAGYSNGDESIGSVHGQTSRWGVLRKHGACYTSHKGGEVLQQVRICLWKN